MGYVGDEFLSNLLRATLLFNIRLEPPVFLLQILELCIQRIGKDINAARKLGKLIFPFGGALAGEIHLCHAAGYLVHCNQRLGEFIRIPGGENDGAEHDNHGDRAKQVVRQQRIRFNHIFLGGYFNGLPILRWEAEYNILNIMAAPFAHFKIGAVAARFPLQGGKVIFKLFEKIIAEERAPGAVAIGIVKGSPKGASG